MILAGKYELDRRLGVGGMAEVFLGRLVGRDGFSRPVAIKRVLAHLASDDALAKMFVAEAQMCARLLHPNIVSVLDFDRDDDGRPFLVIELVDGPSLAELADSYALPTDCAIHIVTELLRGLVYAHDLPDGEDGLQGIIHRDISPHNVLLSWEGAVKLSDFGIAKARAASGVTASELLKGKPAYMSPEQANGEALDGRSDLFAVGIVLWELLAGRSLFSGSTTQETLARVLFAPVPSVRTLRADVPDDLDAVVTRLLARDKTERYASAAGAIAALIACKDSPRDGRGRLVALLADRFANSTPQRRRLVEDAPTVRTPNAQPLPTPRDGRTSQSRSRTWLLALGAIAVACVAVATTVIVLDRREPRTPVVSQPVVALADAGSLADAGVVDRELVAREPNVDATTAIPSRGDARMRRTDVAMRPATSADAANNLVGSGAAPYDAATPADGAPEDPKASARATARNEFLLAQKRYFFVEFPFPANGVKPEEIYVRARREAERLLGKVEDGWVSWNAIRSDGTVDTNAHSLWVHFGAVEPVGDAKCFVVKVTMDDARATLEKEDCRAGFRPRCTARQLHQRATAHGVPERATINASLSGSHWEIQRVEGIPKFTIPNDCDR